MEYDLAPGSVRDHARLPVARKRHPQDASSDHRKVDELERLYAKVPWHRRSKTMTVLLVAALFLVGTPLVVVCFISLTGPIYYRKLAAPGVLKVWSPANKILAVLFLIAWMASIASVLPRGTGQSDGPQDGTAASSGALGDNGKHRVPLPTRGSPVAYAKVGAGEDETRDLIVVSTPATGHRDRPEIKRETVAAWARMLEKHFAARDVNAIVRCFDTQAQLKTSTAGLPLEAEQKTIVHELIGSQLMETSSAWVSNLNIGGLKVLNARVTSNGEGHAVVRMLRVDGGYDYLALTLAASPEGEPLIADSYQLGTGEILTERLRFHAIQTVLPKTTPAGKLSRADLDVLINGSVLTQATGRFEAGQASGAIHLIDQLPESLKTRRSVSLLRARAAQMLGERSFADALERTVPSSGVIPDWTCS
ncbi:MAG TPA: hypothetical protein VGN72_19910 [Tepidisphaeraceae bacterium]|jgi:hypothetical protein|nr:hypothetical protein [Tepidisphaeraceae bacterium]